MSELILFEAAPAANVPAIPAKAFEPTVLQHRMLMRPLPEPELVATVRKNQPLLGLRHENVGASDEEVAERLTRELLARVFPSFENLGPTFDPTMSDADIRALVAKAVQAYQMLGMSAQIEATQQEVESYIGSRRSLMFLREEGLFRSGTFVPVHFLPDLFMATPVWFFAKRVKNDDGENLTRAQRDKAPLPEALRFICDQVRSTEWSDMFLAFNSKVRPIEQYRGESIPIEILSLIGRAKQSFDYVVVATPYHDLALEDWNSDMPWARMPDPFVLGFQRGLPFMFVLGRYSGSGIFPLIHELVADTIGFLTKHENVPEQRFKYESLRWYNSSQPKIVLTTITGTQLTLSLQKAIRAFKAGRLFDWLRGVPATPETA